MQNYYEILQIAPTATDAEIQQAFNQRYGEVLPLVNSHNPQKAAQAQQRQRDLEDIRDTLLDPKSRRAYDAGIGIGGVVAGLADLVATPPMSATSPVGATPPPPPPPPPGSTQVNLWKCPKCHLENPPNTPHCLKCGQALQRTCPECKQLKSMVNTGYCGQCGYSFDMASEREGWRKEIDRRQVEIEGLNAEKIKKEEDFANAFLSLLKWKIYFPVLFFFVIVFSVRNQDSLIYSPVFLFGGFILFSFLLTNPEFIYLGILIIPVLLAFLFSVSMITFIMYSLPYYLIVFLISLFSIWLHKKISRYYVLRRLKSAGFDRKINILTSETDSLNQKLAQSEEMRH